MDVVPAEFLTFIESVNSRVSCFKATLAKPFRDIEASYRLLVADIKTIHHNVALLHEHVGSPMSLKGLEFRSVWDTVDVPGKAVVDLESSNEILDELLQQKVAECVTSENFLQQMNSTSVRVSQRVEQMEQRFSAMEQLLTSHSDRFRTVRAFMQHHQANQHSVSGLQQYSLRLEVIEQWLNALLDAISSRMSSTPSTNFSLTSSLEDLSTMKEEIRMLKQQIGGSGSTVGHKTFQAYEEFAARVKTGIPQGRFGLFVDGHSLLDFFSFVGFLDMESVANSFHSSNKLGFKSMLETRVAASMQNFFPAPFGKTSGDKLEDNEMLPGISDPDKVDNGSTSIKYKILRGMKDVSMQLETNSKRFLKTSQMLIKWQGTCFLIQNVL